MFPSLCLGSPSCPKGSTVEDGGLEDPWVARGMEDGFGLSSLLKI